MSLADDLRFAADTIEKFSERDYSHPSSAEWSAEALRREAGHVEDEEAERDGLVAQLTMDIFNEYGSDFNWRPLAEKLVELGWTKAESQ